MGKSGGGKKSSCLRRWKKGKLLGRGSYGGAYFACVNRGARVPCKDSKFVMKVQKSDNDFRNEVKALKKLKGWKYAPQIYASWTCNGKGYIIMDRVKTKCPKISTKAGYKEMKAIAKGLRKRGLIYVDYHRGNFGCKGKRLVLIDYGWAREMKPGAKTRRHPIAASLGRPVSREELISVGDLNIEDNFNKKGKYNRKRIPARPSKKHFVVWK